MSSVVRFVSLAALVISVSCARNPAPAAPGSAAPTAVATMDPIRSLLPAPTKIERQDGAFPLAAGTVIYTDSEQFAFSARFLGEHIGLAAGPEPLKIEVGKPSQPGSISIRRNNGFAAFGPEGYRLVIRRDGITVHADTAAGAFYGVQTLRQLLPAAWEYEGLRPPPKNAAPINIPALDVNDAPRFAWRGAMLDVARHFLSVDEVKRFIDLMALYKLNRLHLHLADDQGWRIEIKSWPKLTTRRRQHAKWAAAPAASTRRSNTPNSIALRGRAVHHGRPRDRHAGPHQRGAGLLRGTELRRQSRAEPYTGTEVGFSALCVDKDITYTFIDDVVREISALTPGPYFHIGGDEVKTLTPEQYRGFVERVQGIVQGARQADDRLGRNRAGRLSSRRLSSSTGARRRRSPTPLRRGRR